MSGRMQLHIANLGSSFASGPGIPPQIPPAPAARSASNYAHLLATKFNAKLTDLSVSGSTLLDILNNSQVVWGHRFPPQVEALPEDADIVLILSGGNDISYIGGLLHDSINAYFILRLAQRVLSYFTQAQYCVNSLGEEQLIQRYGATLDAIHAKAPKALVVVVEYLTLLGSDVQPNVDVPFGASRLEYHRQVAAKLQRATAKAVEGREQWCRKIPIAELSDAHGIGSEQPWVWGFGLGLLSNKTPYHPNFEGMRAVADILFDRLTNFKTKAIDNC